MELFQISKKFNSNIDIPKSILSKWKEKLILLSEFMESSSVLLSQIKDPEYFTVVASNGILEESNSSELYNLMIPLCFESFINKKYIIKTFEETIIVGKKYCNSFVSFPLYFPNEFYFGVLCITSEMKEKKDEKLIRLASVFVESIHQDIKDIYQKFERDQKALLPKDFLYKVLYDKSGTINCFFDKKKQLILFNENFNKLFIGKQNGIEQGKTLVSLDNYIEKVNSHIEDVLSAKETKVFTDEYITESSVLWLNTEFVPVFNEIEQVVGVHAVGRNITDLVEARQKVKSNKKALLEYERIFKLIANPICVTDINAVFVKVNPAMCKILGYSQSEIEGQSMFGMIHPEDLNRTIQYIQEKIVEQPELLEIENRFVCKNGESVWFSWKVQPIYEEGISYSIAHDITHLKQVEEELIKAKEKAEESDRLKTAFLCNMSHEIRTPMNGIIGFADLLKSLNSDDEYLQYYCNVINASSHQLLRIVNDIIDISKIEIGEFNIFLSKVNINQLFNEVINFHQPVFEKKGLGIKTNFPLNDEEADMNTDGTKLRQILDNLISNSLKFTREGYLSVGYKFEEKRILFFVEDTGVGIPKDKQDSIFNRFIQIRDQTNNFGGTGLGLAICKAYIKKLGGEIWVTSEVGKGSIFNFALPR